MKHSWGILVLLLLTGCATTPAGPTPEQRDSAFLTVWHETFPDGDGEKAKGLAHDVCDAFTAGTSFTDQARYLSVVTNATPQQVGQIIGASTAAYCPEFNNRH